MYNSISNPAYKICLDKDIEARSAETAWGTPLQVLHTLLLGPYKYLLRATMAKLQKQRTQLSALLSAFPSSGFTSRISRNIANYYKSSVGRDFKALAQMALFVLSPFLAPAEIEVWLALSKVF